jgi:hypothetical protein
MIQLSATRCSCIAILWVSLVSFATIILCVASQRVFIVVSVYFVTDSVQKILDTPSYKSTSGPCDKANSARVYRYYGDKFPHILSIALLRDKLSAARYSCMYPRGNSTHCTLHRTLIDSQSLVLLVQKSRIRFPEYLKIIKPVKKFLAYMKTEFSSPCSRKLAIQTNRELVRFDSYFHMLFLQIYFKIIFLSTPWSPMWFFSWRFIDKTVYTVLYISSYPHGRYNISDLLSFFLRTSYKPVLASVQSLRISFTLSWRDMANVNTVSGWWHLIYEGVSKSFRTESITK